VKVSVHEWREVIDTIAENILKSINNNDYQGFTADFSQEMINSFPPSIRPVISPDHDRTEVATQLLEKARNWAQKEGVDSILLRADAEPGQEQDTTWYQSLGFTVREETVCMNYCITGDEKDYERPKGVDLKQIMKVDREDLYYCYYDTFTTGQSPFFFDQNTDEKRASFDLLFETECADTDTSLAIVKDSQVVGFQLE